MICKNETRGNIFQFSDIYKSINTRALLAKFPWIPKEYTYFACEALGFPVYWLTSEIFWNPHLPASDNAWGI